MIYFEIYIIIAALVSVYIFIQLKQHPEITSYIWNYEMDDETRDMLLQYPFLISSTFILLGLMWPVLIYEYIQLKKRMNNGD